MRSVMRCGWCHAICETNAVQSANLHFASTCTRLIFCKLGTYNMLFLHAMARTSAAGGVPVSSRWHISRYDWDFIFETTVGCCRSRTPHSTIVMQQAKIASQAVAAVAIRSASRLTTGGGCPHLTLLFRCQSDVRTVAK